jgi:hypothetical protein
MTVKIETGAIGLTTLILVYGSWIAFALLFLLWKKPAKSEETNSLDTRQRSC